MRRQVYGAFHRAIVEPCLGFAISKEWREQIARSSKQLGQIKTEGALWFHAASVGELESLWTVIESCAKRAPVVVTVFSQSAERSVKKLAESLGSRALYAGAAPWEGRWGKVFKTLKPRAFITAKYEAWPELWMSLGEQGIPLFVVGAQDRPSLRRGKRFCELLGGRPPQITFFTSEEKDSLSLKNGFPQARVILTGEPRWDRVLARGQKQSVRARELVDTELPKPWGVFGSLWVEDLELWRDSLDRLKQATLWVVPHDVSESNLKNLEEKLRALGFAPARSSQGVGGGCVLVDEMGFLPELYPSMDWAYVGGGFGKGVHSTIEPAIQGLPISCGPRRSERFAEIGQLRKSGQLEIVSTASEFSQWLEKSMRCDAELRAARKATALARCGATDRIAEEVLKSLSPA